MSTLRYRGAPASDGQDLVDRKYAAGMVGDSLDAAGVDTAIDAVFSGYATTAYVDAQDELNATKEFVDTGDAARLRKTQVGTNGGPVALDATGKVSPGKIDVPSTQRYPKGFWTPAAYPENDTEIVEEGVEEVLFTCDVDDPGYDYKPMVLGSVDTMVLGTDDGVPPLVRVRLGSPSGPVVASGYGLCEGYSWLTADQFNRTTSKGQGLGPSYFTEFEAGGKGGYIRCDGSKAAWVKEFLQAGTHAVRYRRTGPDATTVGDIQTVQAQFATPPERATSSGGVHAFNYILGRCSADMKYWAGFAISAATVQLVSCMNGVVNSFNFLDEGLLPDPAHPNENDNAIWTARFGQTAGDPRDFILLRQRAIDFVPVPVLWVTVSDSDFPRGPAYRGWGVGFRAGYNEFFTAPIDQRAPAPVNYMVVDEVVIDPEVDPVDKLAARHRASITPAGLSGISALSGPQTLYVTLTNSRAAYVAGLKLKAMANRPSLTVTALSA